jgi:hypothetical protein
LCSKHANFYVGYTKAKFQKIFRGYTSGSLLKGGGKREKEERKEGDGRKGMDGSEREGGEDGKGRKGVN